MGINYLARHSTFDPHPLDSHLSPFLSSDHSLLDFFRLRAVAVTVAYQKKPNSHSLNQLLKFFIFRTASVEKNHLQSLWTSRLPHLPCPLPPSRHRYRSPSAKGSTISDLIQRKQAFDASSIGSVSDNTSRRNIPPRCSHAVGRPADRTGGLGKSWHARLQAAMRFSFV